ncbi:sialate O-acetylesterase [Mariniflexile litorale]|uniref:Sialate O-acetylesterase n=1 Tax=Mariniflexile litorale TaxID=3045158 RepID=A0AAU7EF84_9FLAO|nr:sialate O-acetylesterase [Mariniflexile sp. KMM 9835]MDQ8210821.1 sialate O-acetylesterase [Mariniflexile sp. KMM 9835]
MNKLKVLLIALFLIQSSGLIGQVRLPKLISDGVVLQRDTKIPVWGWASPNEKVTVQFNTKNYKTTASNEGKWELILPKMKAGGPYTMTVSGKNSIEIKDILIGDVWLCSGQSNMEHQLFRHDVIYANEIATANYPEIRHYKVPKTTSISGEKDDLEGGNWQKAVGEEVNPFSVVSYFFAKKIYEKYHIPIGLINASVGGTPIEAWIPKEGYMAYPDILKIIEENKDTAFVNSQKRTFPSDTSVPKITDKGLIGEKPWYAVDFVPKNWRRINIPGYWEDQGIKDLNGVVWYRKNIEIPESMVGEKARVFFGRIVDADELYINGELVGNTTYQYPQRRYAVPENLLKVGKNTFVIRVTNNSGKGGFVSDKPYYIFTEKDTVDLKGYWNYKVGDVFKPSEFKNNTNEKPTRRINPQNEPTSLHNAMVAPYTRFALKGILWYQGESNSGQPEKYKSYMDALITGWRQVFNQPELPFIYAQLPNFMEVSYLPTESSWAEFRAAQLKALSIPNTAMTVNIDLGEWNDIHPENKKDVGERMALAGLKLAYNQDLVYSGPLYKGYEIKENKVIISFNHVGSGLIPNDGEALSEFAIAGKDKKFVWAKAKIEGDKVIVWSDDIETPQYVRYAWADNPDNPNLYNKEGLPASPFETN